MPRPSESGAAPRGRYLATLALSVLGVVYGDIGTSPLYALRESFHGTHGIPVTPGNVLGVLSLVFWSLVLVVTIKYRTEERRVGKGCRCSSSAWRGSRPCLCSA